MNSPEELLLALLESTHGSDMPISSKWDIDEFTKQDYDKFTPIDAGG